VIDERPDDVKTFFRGEMEAVVCFDFQDFPEVAAGDSLSLPTVQISSGPAVMTMGAPEVLTADFEEKDREGNVEKTVPEGKGVKVKISPTAVGGLKGECFILCLVKPSSADADGRIGKRLKCVVK
jgi:hypothetical protein